MTVLSRAISELGIYPAVDPLDSTSRIMDPNVVGQEHYNVARGVQKVLQVGYGVYCILQTVDLWCKLETEIQALSISFIAGDIIIEPQLLVHFPCNYR